MPRTSRALSGEAPALRATRLPSKGPAGPERSCRDQAHGGRYKPGPQPLDRDSGDSYAGTQGDTPDTASIGAVVSTGSVRS